MTNTGAPAGDEVVQLYIHDPVASISQPVRRLRGFQRVTLEPGQTKTVTFTLDRSDFGFYDNRGKFVVEPGEIDVYAGDSSKAGPDEVVHRDRLMGPRRMRRAALAVAVAALLSASGAAAARAADAPGAPGAVATWTEGDKDGIGTATGTASTAWLTIDDGELTEVYAPDLGTPSLRDLQFVVTDGRTFAEREREDATHTVELADPRSLTYRQVNTARSGRWRITKTYVTDPAPATVLVDVDFESLTGRPCSSTRCSTRRSPTRATTTPATRRAARW